MKTPATTSFHFPRTLFRCRLADQASLISLFVIYPVCVFSTLEVLKCSHSSGLIASVGSTGNEGDINLVKTLVESYISKPSCLILLTVACESECLKCQSTIFLNDQFSADFENQGAHHLAKTHDPEGKRTIGSSLHPHNFLSIITASVPGVLTKPDRIPAGDEAGWLDFIRNEREPLENNWYCVKQPSSTDIKNGITWAEARTRENEFFSMTAPWAGLDPMYQRYLRTVNLVERLSNILSDLISKRYVS